MADDLIWPVLGGVAGAPTSWQGIPDLRISGKHPAVRSTCRTADPSGF